MLLTFVRRGFALAQTEEARPELVFSPSLYQFPKPAIMHDDASNRNKNRIIKYPLEKLCVPHGQQKLVHVLWFTLEHLATLKSNLHRKYRLTPLNGFLMMSYRDCATFLFSMVKNWWNAQNMTYRSSKIESFLELMRFTNSGFHELFFETLSDVHPFNSA